MESKFMPTQDLSSANSKLIASIKFQDGCISYSTDESIWDSFYEMMERQWVNTSELPEEWEFDKDVYKRQFPDIPACVCSSNSS